MNWLSKKPSIQILLLFFQSVELLQGHGAAQENQSTDHVLLSVQAEVISVLLILVQNLGFYELERVFEGKTE